MKAIALVASLSLAPIEALQAEEFQKSYEFKIDQETLGEALTELSRQARVPLLYPYDLADRKGMHAIAGRFTVEEALNEMLRDTDFSGGLTESGVITVSLTGSKGQRQESEVTSGNVKKSLLAGVASIMFGAGAGHAQTAPEPLAKDELVVTAQKREQRSQDVPLSVDAVGGDALEKKGITDFRDVLRGMAGISYSGQTRGQGRYSIRGISTTAFSPTVGVYYDDISLVTIATGFSGAAEPPFFDLGRVEVLKGPQGTLYGGSAMGGAIKYVSRKPNLDEFEGSVAAGVGLVAHGSVSYSGEGVVNVPIIEGKLAFRGGVQVVHDSGYIDTVPNANFQLPGVSTTYPPTLTPLELPSLSTLENDDANEAMTSNIKAALQWRPVDAVTVDLSALVSNWKQENSDFFWTNLNGFKSSSRSEEPTSEDLGIYSLSITADIGAVELVSLGGYVTRDTEWDRDYSFFVTGLLPALYTYDSPNTSDTTTKTFTQELRLSSTANDSPLRWVAGLYFSRQEDTLDQDALTIGSGDFFGVGTDLVYQGLHNNVGKEFAAFGEFTYSLLDWLDFTAGFRYFRNNQVLNFAADGVFNGGPTSIVDQRLKEDGFNPKVSVAARVADDSLVYATASKGFRAGGPNRFVVASALCGDDLDRLGLTSAPSSYNSDSLWTYEVGSKNQFLDRRVTANVSAYYSDWKDIQQLVALTSCGFSFTGNVGAAEVYGGEVELNAALTDYLTVGTTAGYTHTEITETVPGVSASVGQDVLQVPRWTVGAYGDYTKPVSQSYLATLHFDYQYRTKTLREFDETVLVSLPDASSVAVPNFAQTQAAYGVANASLMFGTESHEIQLYATNLFDNAPLLDYYDLLIASGTTLRPRTIGLRFRGRF
ncbi:MAG TPA: TonB-dependent receptor [Amphiplicatus sp.]|nr:TonB-dependent receptor [Amphiplicatus sp.]